MRLITRRITVRTLMVATAVVAAYLGMCSYRAWQIEAWNKTIEGLDKGGAAWTVLTEVELAPDVESERPFVTDWLLTQKRPVVVKSVHISSGPLDSKLARLSASGVREFYWLEIGAWAGDEKVPIEITENSVRLMRKFEFQAFSMYSEQPVSVPVFQDLFDLDGVENISILVQWLTDEYFVGLKPNSHVRSIKLYGQFTNAAFPVLEAFPNLVHVELSSDDLDPSEEREFATRLLDRATVTR